MGYILALDQGTTSSRSMVFDAQLNVVASAQRPLPIHTPQTGWVEQDAEEMWAGQMATMQEALSRAGLLASDIALAADKLSVTFTLNPKARFQNGDRCRKGSWH